MDQESLAKLKAVQIDILDEIVRICTENRLTYFLIGGTLLGAIRHKGMIPWDDDIDIAMPRKDFEKLMSLCETQLQSAYYCQYNVKDHLYWHPFAKIRKNGTVFEEPATVNCSAHKGIYVDIFPLDNAGKQKSLFQTFQAKLSKSMIAVIMQRHRIVTKTSISKKTKLLLWLTLWMPVSALSRLQNAVMRLNKNERSKYFVNLGSQYHYVKQTIEKDRFLPPVQVEFEGKYYSAPKDYHYFLSRIYGDYMKLPPEEKRINHNPIKIVF